MPKGKFDTPGPFRADAKGVIWKTIGPTVSHSCTTVPKDFDAAEIEELVDLLNKGTHFDNLKSAMLEAQSGQYSRADANRILRSALNTIAKAEGKDDE